MIKKEIFDNKKLPFKVPVNYFEDFENRLMAQIRSNNHKADSKRSAPVIAVIKPWLAMAAGFVLIALIYHQAPKFFNYDTTIISAQADEEAFINSLAFIVDENDLNEFILNSDSGIILPPDTFFIGRYTEEELAALTYFE